MRALTGDENGSMTEPSPRARRRSAEEVRALMIETGSAMVLRDGVVLDMANLSFEEVIRASGAPRTTAYRLWPQRVDFLVELLDSLFGVDGSREPVSGFDEGTLILVEQVLHQMRDQMLTPEGRSVVLREITRQGLARNLTAVTDSIPWRAYRSAIAVVTSGAFADDEEHVLREGLRRIEERFLDRMAGVFSQLADAFQRRFISGVTPRDLAVVTASIVEGIVERRHLLDPQLGDVRPVSISGAPTQDWNLAAIATYAQFITLTEERQ